MGRQAWLVCGDFNNIFEPEAVMRTAWEMAGWVDILVNNAAEFSQMTLLEMTSEEIEEIWRVNTLAPIILAKSLADLASGSEILPDDYCGKVINILDRRATDHVRLANQQIEMHLLSRRRSGRRLAMGRRRGGQHRQYRESDNWQLPAFEERSAVECTVELSCSISSAH